MIIDVVNQPDYNPRQANSSLSIERLGTAAADLLNYISLPRLILQFDFLDQDIEPNYQKLDNTPVFAVMNPHAISTLKVENEYVSIPSFEIEFDNFKIENLFFPAITIMSLTRKFAEEENKLFYRLLSKSINAATIPKTNIGKGFRTVYNRVKQTGKHNPVIMCNEAILPAISTQYLNENTDVYIIPEKDLPNRIYVLPSPDFFGIFTEVQKIGLLDTAVANQYSAYLAYEEIGMAILHPALAEAIDVI